MGIIPWFSKIKENTVTILISFLVLKKTLQQHFLWWCMTVISHFIYFRILRRTPYGGDNLLYLSVSVWFTYFLHWDFNCWLKLYCSYLWKVFLEKRYSPGSCTYLFEPFNAFVNCSFFSLTDLYVLRFPCCSLFSWNFLNQNNFLYVPYKVLSKGRTHSYSNVVKKRRWWHLFMSLVSHSPFLNSVESSQITLIEAVWFKKVKPILSMTGKSYKNVSSLSVLSERKSLIQYGNQKTKSSR